MRELLSLNLRWTVIFVWIWVIQLQLFKGRFFDTFKKEKAEHKAKSEEDSDEEPQTYLTYVNNLLHSLFSNCEVNFNNTMA